ncbi:hypothetical protein [Vibrio marisflavi]|uniref:hypothetical protein n=1 Tax=Vibrio marisflavi TaxID=1216040 RepID=UPI001F47E54B|nr:hypothetical protein [Vibrio marisflavi]
MFDDTYNSIFSILFRTMPSEIMMKDLVFQRALQGQIGTQESPTFGSTEDLNRLYFPTSDKEIIIQRIEKVFELVSTYVSFIGEDSAKEQLRTSKNGFMAQLRNDLNSTSENIKIMLLSADRLNQLGYSSLLLKYRFNTICELSMLLSRLGLINSYTLSILSVYWSQPDHTSNSIRLPNALKDNLFKRFIDEFGQEQMGSIDSWTLSFENYTESSRGNLVTRYKLSRNNETIYFDLLNGCHRTFD